MQGSWKETHNSANLKFTRSVDGYAAESLVIGRALLCGYNLFFKAWRDSPYDAVLDYQSVLFRVEIKGTTDFKSLSLTGGGRSGKQISRKAQSRERVVTKKDCEFLIGTTSLNGDCYIIPSEVLQILNRKTLSLNALIYFKEKWKIFNGGKIFLPIEIQEGFLKKSLTDLKNICKKNGIKVTPSLNYPWEGVKGKSIKISSKKESLALDIWKHLYRSI